MPNYNLNKEDVHLIVESLNNSAFNSHSTDQHSIITSLRDKLISKLDEDEEVDVWAAFQVKPK